MSVFAIDGIHWTAEQAIQTESRLQSGALVSQSGGRELSVPHASSVSLESRCGTSTVPGARGVIANKPWRAPV